MATTWGDFTGRIRRALEDQDAVDYQWSDEELLDYYHAYCRALATRVPLDTIVTVPVIAGTSTYALPDTLRQVVLVVYDTGHEESTLAEIELVPNQQLSRNRRGYTIVGDTLTLFPSPTAAAEMRLHARARYEIPANAEDDAHVLSISPEAELAAEYYIRYRAFDRLSGSRAELAQWENSEKNPLVMIADRLYKQYEREIAMLEQEQQSRFIR